MPRVLGVSHDGRRLGGHRHKALLHKEAHRAHRVVRQEEEHHSHLDVLEVVLGEGTRRRGPKLTKKRVLESARQYC